MAMWEILGTLAHGGTLVIRGSDLEETARTADVIIATPSVLASLDPEACQRARTVAVAGERCPQSLADMWSRNAVFYNACGPTEVTIVNTMQRYDPNSGRITIGRRCRTPLCTSSTRTCGRVPSARSARCGRAARA